MTQSIGLHEREMCKFNFYVDRTDNYLCELEANHEGPHHTTVHRATGFNGIKLVWPMVITIDWTIEVSK